MIITHYDSDTWMVEPDDHRGFHFVTKILTYSPDEGQSFTWKCCCRGSELSCKHVQTLDQLIPPKQSEKEKV